MGLLLVAGFLGLSLATAALLAIWVAFGRSSWIRRGTCAIFGGSAAGLAFCLASGELELEWLGLMWIVVMTVALMFLSVRCFGVRLVVTNHEKSNQVQTNDDPGVYSNESQFTIRQLMILTAATAAIAAVARSLTPLMMTIEVMMFGGGIAICLGVLALVAVWTTLRVELNRTRFLVLTIISLTIAALVYCVMEVTEADPGLVWACVVVIYAAALSAALLCARSRGIRLLCDHESRVDAVKAAASSLVG